MLDNDLLQLQQGGPFRQVAVKGLRRWVVLHLQLLNAPAAASLGGLGHKHRVARQEVQHFRFVIPGHRNPVPVEEPAKAGVEPDFVAEIVHVGFVVIFHHNVVVPAPGEVGVPLRLGQVVHLKQVVVHIARAVLHRTGPHVLKDGPAGTARLFVDGADFVQHGPVIHVQHPLNQIFYFHRNLPLFLFLERKGNRKERLAHYAPRQ